MNIDRIEMQSYGAEDYDEQVAAMQDAIQEQAKREASRILKKNKREIERLKKHGQMCLLSGNKHGYVYAINKLRGIYKQPQVDAATGETLYETSRQRLIELIQEQAK